MGEDDWRELRKAVGLVSSSVRQRIEDGETALETVVTGKTATLNHWGRISAVDRRKALGILRRIDAAPPSPTGPGPSSPRGSGSGS